jgi:hypothetical protein
MAKKKNKKKKKKPAQESKDMTTPSDETPEVETTEETTEPVETTETESVDLPEDKDEKSESDEETPTEETADSEPVVDTTEEEGASTEDASESEPAPEETGSEVSKDSAPEEKPAIDTEKMVDIASDLSDKLSTMPPVEKVKVISKEEAKPPLTKHEVIQQMLLEYIAEFRKNSSIKSKTTMDKFSVKLARILMLIHKTEDVKTLDMYLDFMVNAKDCNSNVVYAMDHVIKNGSRERNSIMLMHSTFSMIARSVRKKTPFRVKDEVLRKSLTNKAILNYIFSKK